MESEKRTVLVVDDEFVNRRIIQRCMQAQYTLLEATNGLEALSILETHPEVAAVLLDIVMPKMGGLSFLDELQRHSFHSIPVIVMTADNNTDTELEALRHGATDFIGKPFHPQILLSRVANAIARSQVALYERMQYISDHDALTGLLRREKMFRTTRRMLAENPDTRFVFLRLDADHFHLYNTSFGEPEGDRLLKQLAMIVTRIAQSAQPSVTGRLNADVFCICMPYKPETLPALLGAAAKELAEYRSDYMLKLCIGAYVIDDRTMSVEEIDARAAAGAKKCKGNYSLLYGMYDATEENRSEQEQEITNEMRNALREHQFVIYLQPKYALDTEHAAGGEALVRWNHPTKGIISPGVFIPLFEKNGFIAELDQYIWEQVCIMLRSWLDAGYTPLPISTNISRISLYNPNLVNVLVALVKKYDLPPRLLQLEITESAYMSDPDLMHDTLAGLRRAGFTLLMDDFGSGYSSLNTLKDIEVDILKIDMKFLPTGENMERGEIILASIVRMASWLGMIVVVEGVETKRQRDFINGIGAEYIQGYYYARPMPNKEYFDRFIREQSKAHTTVPAETKEAPDVPLHNMTILVIDDDITSRGLLNSYFSGHYHVHLCESVADGLDYLRSNSNVKLILVGQMSEGMSGMDFLEYCRTDDVLSTIPKIIVSISNNDTDMVNAFRLGAYDYIAKPLVHDVVFARVRHALNMTPQVRSYESMGRRLHSTVYELTDSALMDLSMFRRSLTQLLLSRSGGMQALLKIHIDNADAMRAQHGEAAYSELMHTTADLLLHSFRKSDLIARSGSTFLVMMVNLPDFVMAEAKAEAISSDIVHTAAQLQFDIHCATEAVHVEKSDSPDDILTRAGIE